jgi:hypothetical protein
MALRLCQALIRLVLFGVHYVPKLEHNGTGRNCEQFLVWDQDFAAAVEALPLFGFPLHHFLLTSSGCFTSGLTPTCSFYCLLFIPSTGSNLSYIVTNGSISSTLLFNVAPIQLLKCAKL